MQHVFNLKILAKQFHKGLFIRIRFNLCWVWELLFQLFNYLHIAPFCLARHNIHKAQHILVVAFFKHHILRIGIAKQANGIYRCLFKVSKRNDVAKGFCGIVNAVGTRESLNQPMIAQIFIHKQGVECGRIKARKEHTHHDKQVYFLVFHPIREVAIIVLEPITIHAVIGFKHGVVVVYGHR